MKINKKFLPLKAHYFCFLGSISPILPFMLVVARQLGIPVIVLGSIGAAILILTVIIKPLLGLVADTFPSIRKALFIGIISTMVVSLSSIALLPPMYGNNIKVSGHLFSNETSNSTFLLIDKGTSDCYVESVWDCSTVCSNETLCNNFTVSTMTYEGGTEEYSYVLGKSSGFLNESDQHLSFSCGGGIYIGNDCRPLWSIDTFWAFIILYAFGWISFSVGASISDAVCLDSVGEEGSFGNERAWGTVGWGLMGPISGYFIDLVSGTNISKNYTPAFLILLILGSIDVLIASATLKVPRIKAERGVWTTVAPVFKKPEFLIFIFFVIFNGAFDGVAVTYVFLMQEDMAKGTQYMMHMKLLQGFTLFVECTFEAPFMWVSGWFTKMLGARGVISLVFFLYMFRLLGLALVGSYGPVWATLITEVLNGPCYGLGYTAVVVQAGNLSPVGTSATVQSVVNLCYESIGYALAAFLGGVIYSTHGGPAVYYVFGGISVVIFILHLLYMLCFKEDQMLEKTKAKVEILDQEEVTPLKSNPDSEKSQKILSLN